MKKLFLFLAAVICAASMSLTVKADVLTFDFEGTNPTIPDGWINDPTYPWIVVNSAPEAGFGGEYCIKSGNGGIASSSSTLQATFTFAEDGSISFVAGCWGEGTSTYWDQCLFYIDGELKYNMGSSGSWVNVSFEVSAGTHTFRWEYTKDGSVNPTGDAFYVDNIVVNGGAPVLGPKVEDGWVHYDNGTYDTSLRIGGNGIPFYWGVNIPAGTLPSERKYLKKVSIYGASLNGQGDAWVQIYQGGTTPLDADYLYAQDVYLNGENAFQEIVLRSAIEVDPSQNIWIVFKTDADYLFMPASYSSVGYAPDARWIGTPSNGSIKWEDITDSFDNHENHVWMIRGFFDVAPYASNALVSDITHSSAHLTWEGNEEEYDLALYVWNFESEKYELLTIESIEGKELTLTELSQGTSYLVVVAPHGGFDASGQVLVDDTQFTTITFATINPCKVQPVVEISELKSNSAQISWTGMVENYKIGYVATDPTMPATILFIENNVWGDGSGYQMLIDADANTYDRLLSEDHDYFKEHLTGNIPNEIYAEYEYKIPENADGNLETTNIVRNGRVFLDIPAGTYDWVITNPSPSSNRMYFVGDNGNAPRSADDWVFEGGMAYTFIPKLFGNYDGVNVDVSPITGWIMTDDVTSPFTLTNLTPNTTYVVQVKVDCDNGEGVDSEILHFTTPEEDTGMEAVSGERLEVSGSSKILHEGNLYLLRDGKIFNAQGARVK